MPNNLFNQNGAHSISENSSQSKWFWGVLNSYFPIYKDVIIASFVINLLALASPLFVMNIYDRIIPNNAIESLWVLASGVILAYCIDFVLRTLRSHFIDLVGRDADVMLSNILIDKVVNVRMGSLTQTTGAFANTLRELEHLREFFSSTSLVLCIDLPFAVIFIILIGYIGGSLVFIPLIALPVMMLIAFVMQKKLHHAAKEQFQKNLNKHSFLTEIIGGLESIKTNQMHASIQTRWMDIAKDFAQSNIQSKHFASKTIHTTLFISATLSTLFIILGTCRISETLMSMGGLVACVILLGRAMQPLTQLSTMYTQLVKCRVALKSLSHFMSLPSESRIDENSEIDSCSIATPSSNATDSLLIEASYKLENVKFYYPSQTNQANPFLAIDINNLKIKAGDKIALTGKPGSGKTTLARLLMGLYNPQEGTVRLGDRDIASPNMGKVKQRIAFMAQDNYLFSGSIYDNIAMGKPDATPAEVKDAAILAGIMPYIIRHPHGFDLQVGERGMFLSGGQRQCVALARVVIRNPSIIILDEPTSNLDYVSEKEILENCLKCFADKTLILCIHKHSALTLVNRIIVLDNGKIAADASKDVILKMLTRSGKI